MFRNIGYKASGIAIRTSQSRPGTLRVERKRESEQDCSLCVSFNSCLEAFICAFVAHNSLRIFFLVGRIFFLIIGCIFKHRTPINYLILNLAMADALYATLIIPMYIFRFNLSHPTGLAGDVLCVMLTNGSFAWVAAIAAICTLLAIAIERYYAVVYPLGNKWKCSISAVKVCIRFSIKMERLDS